MAANGGQMPSSSIAADESLEAWILDENARATEYLMRNVSPPGAMPGVIIASPSRSNPDYYYHWVRDSGIAARAILWLYESVADPPTRRRYLDVLMDFVEFSKHIQRTAVELGSGLGEPKFNVDGTPFTLPWARPQFDGPAIRAIELTHLAFLLLAERKLELVREKLFDARLPTGSVIKTDLEYISHHVDETCFDCWEEIRGHSFFTQLLERKALQEGAELARRLGDTGAARWYDQQANLLAEVLPRHWDPRRRFLVATLDREGGTSDARSGLDSSVLIATLGGYSTGDDLLSQDLYPVDQEQVLATAVALEDAFAALYPINAQSRQIPGIAIGRYPEDRYNGYRANAQGNPWPSITIAFAMYYYKLARRYRVLQKIRVTSTNLSFFLRLQLGHRILRAGDTLHPSDPRFVEIVEALEHRGDTFLARVRYHINPDGSMSEEMNRITGFQQGARDLSMSYAAFILAVGMRNRA
jgi:glucoamylase